MKSEALLLAALAVPLGAATAHAQQTPVLPPTTASAEVMQCAQAQMVVDRLLSTANITLETARQSNSASEMRSAVDDLQATLRDVRAQLAPCANVQPATDDHAGHGMPSGAATPATSSAPSTMPAPPVPAAAPPKPTAADPHAGHVTTPVAPAATKPAAPSRPPTTAKPLTAKPPASDPHAGHDMAPAKPAPAPAGAPPAKPAPTTKPPAGADPHGGHTTTAAPDSAAPQNEATDPVCGLKVDPKTAPSAQHEGRTYYFCSEPHRQLFSKTPAKYLPGRR